MICPVTEKTCKTNGCTTKDCYQRFLGNSKITLQQEKKLYTEEKMCNNASDFLNWFVLDKDEEVSKFLQTLPAHYSTTEVFKHWWKQQNK